MSLSSQLARLEDQRRQELSLLRTRSAALAHSLQNNSAPAQWIRNHPYLATSAAALVGLAAAQLPLRFPSLPKPAPSSPSSPPSAPPPSPAPSATPLSSFYADLLPLLLDFARQLLEPHDDSPATVTPADAGAIAGPAFPQSFSSPTPHAPQNSA